MRLLLGTHNPKGLEVFRDVQWKVEIQQNEKRRNLKIGDSAQADFFSSTYSTELHQQIDGIGCQKYKDAAETIILDFLKEQNYKEFGSYCDEPSSDPINPN